jgi:hypothetical protein
MQIQTAKVQRTCVETICTVVQIANFQYCFSMDISIKDLRFIFSESYWEIQTSSTVQPSFCRTDFFPHTLLSAEYFITILQTRLFIFMFMSLHLLKWEWSLLISVTFCEFGSALAYSNRPNQVANFPPLHQTIETDPVSETLHLEEFKTMHNVQITSLVYRHIVTTSDNKEFS